MRRPNICGSSVSIVDESYKPSNRPHKEPNRISLMRRMLGGGSKKKELYQVGRQFGVPLSDLLLFKGVAPKVLYRMCTYLEAYGLNNESLFKGTSCDQQVVEILKSEFNKEGDAKLEDVDNPTYVASLLKLWLNELPEPLLSKEITIELLSVMKKYKGDSLWSSVTCDSILGCGVLTVNSINLILRLLHAYTLRYPATMIYIPSVFTPLLAHVDKNSSRQETVDLIAKLIENYSAIFNNLIHNKDSAILKSVTESNNLKQTALVISEIAQNQKQRKRKERHDSGSKSDPKFVRSNSEERPAVKTACSEMKIDTMRRVSSHEDFSKSKVPSVQPKTTTPGQVKKIVHPLHERNTRSPELVLNIEPSEKLVLTSSVGYASELYDENEHEMRRNSERFAPQHSRSLGGRRRRIKHKVHRAKENEELNEANQEICDESDISIEKEETTDNQAVDALEFIDIGETIETGDSIDSGDGLEAGDCDSATPVTSSSEQSLKLDDNLEEYVDKCPSPIGGYYSPTLDLKARPEQVMGSEPVSITPLWSTIPPSEERMVSPRNSIFMSRRVFTAGPGATPDEVTILDLNAQIQGLKQKLKKYEEGFEREFGFKPSHSDKAANPDIRKMISMLNKLRKQAKNKKEDVRIANMEKSKSVSPISDDIVLEIEKRLREKRKTGGRCESLDSMNHDQLVEEKSAMQKALLQLEATYGRPQSKHDRDVVRPLYDRYREIKKNLLKHTPSKMKESVSELGTILEHEAMDFCQTALPPSPPRTPSPPAGQVTIDRKTISQQVVLDNLHSLPREKLLELQKATLEEKKRLKRSLKQQELEMQSRTGRRLLKDDRPSLDPLYTDYKQAKAKLKFIEALINKAK